MKLKFIAALFVSIGLAVGVVWGVAHAQSFRTGNSTTVAEEETIDSSLWTAGRTVDIAGTVNGDIFCAGQNVTISGTVRGDVLCAAQTITISGTVNGDVRAAAQNLSITGRVDRSATVAAQSFTQSGRSRINGDISIAADHASLSGQVARDAALSAQNVDINGSIGRNVQAVVPDLSLGSRSVIGGNLHYTSAEDLKMAGGATVEGKTTKTTPKAGDGQKTWDNGFGWFGAGTLLYFFVAGLVVALVLALFFPQAFHAVSGQAIASPGKTALVGLVAVIVVPALILLLMVTVIGIPLALLLLVAWVLIQALAGLAFAYYLGRLVWRRQHNPIVIVLIGSVILLILYLIPIVGFIAFLAAMFFGTGMILRELNSRRPAPRYKLE